MLLELHRYFNLVLNYYNMKGDSSLILSNRYALMIPFKKKEVGER